MFKYIPLSYRFSSHVFKAKSKAFTAHMVASAVVLLGIGCALLWMWYPGQWSVMGGGVNMFTILMICDVVMGPSLTFVLYHPEKSRREIRLDLGLTVVCQLAAMGYGLYTLHEARPVFAVFAADRFEMVAQVDANDPTFQAAMEKSNIRTAITGPLWYAARKAKDDEVLDFVEQALKGRDVQLRPELYQPMASECKRIWEKSKPVAELEKFNSEFAQAYMELTAKVDSFESPEGIHYVPLVAQKMGVVLINQQCEVLGMYRIAAL